MQVSPRLLQVHTINLLLATARCSHAIPRRYDLAHHAYRCTYTETVSQAYDHLAAVDELATPVTKTVSRTSFKFLVSAIIKLLKAGGMPQAQWAEAIRSILAAHGIGADQVTDTLVKTMAGSADVTVASLGSQLQQAANTRGDQEVSLYVLYTHLSTPSTGAPLAALHNISR